MSKDIDDIMKKLNKFVVNAEKAIDDTVMSIAVRVRNQAVRDMREHSVGTVYLKKGGEGVRHISSRPGDAPNVDTGRLIGSINVVHQKLSMTALVGTALPYGAILELLKNRPWLKPALDSKLGDYHKTLLRRLDKQIRDAGK